MSVIDQVIFSTSAVKVGTFRCTRDDPHFEDSGPIEDHLVVFPRTSVWICHDGSRPFVADPNLATVYNCGQQYTRAPLAEDGDRGDWFAVSAELASEIARTRQDVADFDTTRPFRTEYLWVPAKLYARQRLVVRLIEQGADALEVEALALDVVAAAIRAAQSSEPLRPHSSSASEAHRDLAMRTRAEIARRLFEPLDLETLARLLEVSPWHLCRVFKQQTGRTIQGYRRDLRLRTSLERLEQSAGGISQLAHQFGFSSHSHFTAMFRQRFGFTPSFGTAAMGGRA